MHSAHLRRVDSSVCSDWFSATGTSSAYKFNFLVKCPESEGVIHGVVEMVDVPANISGHYEDSAALTLEFNGGKSAPNPQKPFKGLSGSWSATESWTTDGGESGGQCVTGATGDGDEPC
jgi:hypothetical protein